MHTGPEFASSDRDWSRAEAIGLLSTLSALWILHEDRGTILSSLHLALTFLQAWITRPIVSTVSWMGLLHVRQRT